MAGICDTYINGGRRHLRLVGGGGGGGGGGGEGERFVCVRKHAHARGYAPPGTFCKLDALRLLLRPLLAQTGVRVIWGPPKSGPPGPHITRDMGPGGPYYTSDMGPWGPQNSSDMGTFR